MARAIKQLEPMQRELLWLAYAQGSSHREIGDVTQTLKFPIAPCVYLMAFLTLATGAVHVVAAVSRPPADPLAEPLAGPTAGTGATGL